MAGYKNSVDPDQTAPGDEIIWNCTKIFGHLSYKVKYTETYDKNLSDNILIHYLN